MIEVRNLTKYYGSVAAIRDVSFDVGQGEILGFLGPNGAGKTTTMRILTGYFPATAGTAKVGGFDVFNQLDEVRKRVGYLPENVPIYQDMPVHAYLKHVAQIKGISGRNRKKAVERVISDVSLGSVQNRLIKKLSKGYRQRVGLAQALINDPRVLILDEPTVGLDPKQITEIRSLIKHLAGDRTVILSTHILPEVSITCQKVAIIHEGRIVTVDTLENLTQKSAKETKLEISVEDRAEEALSIVRGIAGVISVQPGGATNTLLATIPTDQEIRPEIAKQICAKGIELLEMKSRQVSLEEVFIHHITGETSAAAKDKEVLAS